MGAFCCGAPPPASNMQPTITTVNDVVEDSFIGYHQYYEHIQLIQAVRQRPDLLSDGKPLRKAIIRFQDALSTGQLKSETASVDMKWILHVHKLNRRYAEVTARRKERRNSLLKLRRMYTLTVLPDVSLEAPTPRPSMYAAVEEDETLDVDGTPRLPRLNEEGTKMLAAALVQAEFVQRLPEVYFDRHLSLRQFVNLADEYVKLLKRSNIEVDILFGDGDALQTPPMPKRRAEVAHWEHLHSEAYFLGSPVADDDNEAELANDFVRCSASTEFSVSSAPGDVSPSSEPAKEVKREWSVVFSLPSPVKEQQDTQSIELVAFDEKSRRPEPEKLSPAVHLSNAENQLDSDNSTELAEATKLDSHSDKSGDDSLAHDQQTSSQPPSLPAQLAPVFSHALTGAPQLVPQFSLHQQPISV